MGEKFSTLFAGGEIHLWRAPGRVNLIGEHTDYNNLPVLPMAIPFDVFILFAPREDGRITLGNTSSDYELRSFMVAEAIPPYEAGDWGNYAKAAVQGIVSNQGWERRTWRGFDGVVDGTIPTAAGLSSSSALVVAFALAFAESNQIRMARPELAELMADSERYVGTRGGGMDQAVCLLAEEGSALLIRFFPLRTEPVNVPRDAAFVVCHSMVSAPKSREIRAAYNLRALESRLAAEILARRLGAVSEPGDVPFRLGDLISSDPDESASDLLDTLEKISRGTPWNPEAVARTLGLSLDCLSDTWFKPFNTELDPDRPLKILERARHVLTEGERVHRASDALRRGDLEALGALMNASHESCARDYEISVPELDRLVEVARRNGAIGSRLTGAGFGGCTVSLVLKGQVEVFCRKVAEDFYGTSWVSQFHGFPDRQQEKAPPIYPCRPVPGASKIL